MTDKTVNGITYRVVIEPDYDQCAPWKEYDGHGIVSDWTTRDKRPGELILCTDRNSKIFYDFAETMKIAKRDGWHMAKSGKDLHDAVMQDFKRMRAWCNDEWNYIGIAVYPLTADGDELKSKSQSAWGIESDSEQSYIDEIIDELIGEIELCIGQAAVVA